MRMEIPQVLTVLLTQPMSNQSAAAIERSGSRLLRRDRKNGTGPRVSVILVSAAFDDLRSKDVRFLHAASRLGEVHVLLWSDRAVA